MPQIPVVSDIGNGISLELWPWHWADFATYVMRSPELYHLQLMQTRLCRGNVVFDIGAYIGTYSFAASVIVDSGHVYAFEPNPFSADRIHEAIERNNISNITLCRAAMTGMRQDAITITLAEYPPQSANVASDLASVNSIQSPAWSIDSYCDVNHVQRIDFFKVDVEGAEYDVLRGAAETLQAHRPEILLEIHAVYLSQRGHTVTDVVSLLDALGYRFYDVGFGLTGPRQKPLTRTALVDTSYQRSRLKIFAKHSD